MKKIGWILTSLKKYGGSFYGKEARKILSKDFDIEVKNLEARHFKWRYLKLFGWFLNFLKLKGKKDLWVIPSFLDLSFVLLISGIKGKKLLLVHHIDNSVFSLFLKPLFFLTEKFFYHNLKKIDAIITVSEYWEKHFLDKGYSNVYKIYNPFNLADFRIRHREISKFKKKFKLEGKPIIYIGNCQRAKGVVEVFGALKNLDVHLVTSGERRVKIPTVNLNMEYKDYLRLLKASSIVITMSKFKEGWCRTAHEAMLCKKPVIGSGLGGMKELLEGGRQIICENPKKLKEKVEYLLNHPKTRKKMGEKGYNFAKKFTFKKFKKEWLKLVKKIL